MHPSGILTISEAALTRRWGSRRTIGRWIKAGLLPARVIGLVTLVREDHLDSVPRIKPGPKPQSKRTK